MDLAEKNGEEKGYEVKDKRRVNADGSLKEDAEPAAQEPKGADPQDQPETPTAEAAAPEEGPAAEEAAAPEAEVPQQEEAEAPGAEEEMPLPNVYQTLNFVAGLLVEQAWQFMGLRLPPGRKEPIRDMAQAKIAIDTLIFIADKLHSQLDEDGRKALRGLISDLQLNFVQHGQ